MNIPHIPHAFENIKNTCDRILLEHYPKRIPEDIVLHYHQELNYLKESRDATDGFEIFRLLSEEAAKCSTFISMSGTVTGSLLYYLLGDTGYNPLPVHYYCPECGYYEPVDTHLFGIDLPEKECPLCGNVILGEGFDLPLESVWGNDGKKPIRFAYNIGSAFYPSALKVLRSVYPESAVEDIFDLEKNLIKKVQLSSLPEIDSLMQLQHTTGIHVNELTATELRKITGDDILRATALDPVTASLFQVFTPQTYRDMAALFSSAHSSFSWQEGSSMDLNTYERMLSSNAFRKYPCFMREDFFDCLLKEGFDRSFAFEVSEKIRKGHANSSICKEAFYQLPIPEELKEAAGNYLYIPPRALCIEHVLIYARLAYFGKKEQPIP